MLHKLEEHSGAAEQARQEVQNNSDNVIAGKKFLQAVAKGNIPFVKQYIMDNEDNSTAINVVDEEGNSALMLAAANRDYSVVETLLKNPKTEIDKVNASGNTALLQAVLTGYNLRVIQHLLDKGADPTVKNKANEAADDLADGKVQIQIQAAHFFHAAKTQNIGLFEDCIKKYSATRILYRDHLRNTPLIYAARNGHLEMVKRLVYQQSDIFHKNNNEKTAADEALLHGHKEVFELLRTADFCKTFLSLDVAFLADSKAKLEDDIACFVDAYNGKSSLVQAMIKSGKSVNTVNEKGETALTWAGGRGYRDILELAKSTTEINTTNKQGETALILAAKNGHLSTVQYLIGAKADIHCTNRDGQNAFTASIRPTDCQSNFGGNGIDEYVSNILPYCRIYVQNTTALYLYHHFTSCSLDVDTHLTPYLKLDYAVNKVSDIVFFKAICKSFLSKYKVILDLVFSYNEPILCLSAQECKLLYEYIQAINEFNTSFDAVVNRGSDAPCTRLAELPIKVIPTEQDIKNVRTQNEMLSRCLQASEQQPLFVTDISEQNTPIQKIASTDSPKAASYTFFKQESLALPVSQQPKLSPSTNRELEVNDLEPDTASADIRNPEKDIASKITCKRCSLM